MLTKLRLILNLFVVILGGGCLVSTIGFKKWQRLSLRGPPLSNPRPLGT
jgi:hypothetical protein